MGMFQATESLNISVLNVLLIILQNSLVSSCWVAFLAVEVDGISMRTIGTRIGARD